MERIIGVKFKQKDSYGRRRDGTTYHYMTDIEGLEKGDTVVVESPSEGLTCVEVVATEETEIGVEKASKWVVQKIDTTAYKERQEKEKKRKLILAKLHKKQQEWLAENQFKLFAEHDPDAAKLLEELKAL